MGLWREQFDQSRTWFGHTNWRWEKIGEVVKVDTAVAWLIEHCANILNKCFNKERMAGCCTKGCGESKLSGFVLVFGAV